MAAEGYPSSKGGCTHSTPRYPRVLRRNARWRPIVRLLAKERGWRFIDAYFHTYYKDFPSHLMFGVSTMHMGVKNAEG